MITKEDEGRRVLVNGEVAGELFNDSKGTIVYFFDFSDVIGIRFDEYRANFHDCNGDCDKGHGWYVYEENIKLVDVTVSGIQKGSLEPQKYSSLEAVLKDALSQANSGKGVERHANNNNFEDQVICVVGRLLKGHRYAAHAYQAIKKTIEAGRLYDIKGKDAAYNEILGAINYLSALAIMIKED